MPLFAAPDEPSHTVRAASVARGQLRGPEHVPHGRPTVTEVLVPEVFDSAHKVPKCFLRRPAVTPACSPPLSESERLVASGTYMGRYPPAYYAVVGLPSRWAASATGVHLMRLVSAAVAAALLASALATARADRSGSLALGMALAATPMVLFLSGSVNPNGVEIAASIGLWVSLLALAGDGRSASTASVPALAARIAVAGAVLAVSRPLGPLWLAAAVAVVAYRAGGTRLRELAREPAVRTTTTVLAATGAAAAAWGLAHDSYGGWGEPRGPELSTARMVVTSLGRTGDNVLQMVGVFGWTDTRAPLVTYALWLGLLAIVAGAALAAGTRRTRLALLGLAAVVVAVPVVGEASQHIGFYWLGRYTLPLAVGLPLLAADGARPVLARFRHRLPWAIAALAAAHVLAFVWTLRRFTVGVGKGWGPATWAPPVPALVLAAAFAGAAILYAKRLSGLSDAHDGRTPLAPAEEPELAPALSPASCGGR